MSSRGRKSQPQNDFEFFPTPYWVVFSLLEELELPGGRWIEPCAGSGNIIHAVNAVRDDVDWTICEIDPRFDYHLRPIRQKLPRTDLLPYADFVHRRWEEPMAEVLLMNPPFSLAHQFVKAAFGRARWVVCLQRGNWFGSKLRSPWLQAHCPDIYGLPERPSFTPDGKTDSSEYSWYVWPPGTRERRRGQVMMLDKPIGQQMSLL